MHTRRCVLLKPGQDPAFRQVGCPEEGDNRPFDYVIWIDELFVRREVCDQHDDQGRICAYVFQPHYEL